MNAFAYFPSRPHWTSHQLADAVPQRVHELFAFASAEADARPAANGEGRRTRAVAPYARRTVLPARFVVR